MNKIFFITALLFSMFSVMKGQTEKLNQLFDKYQESEGVTSIKISKPMFSMLNKLNIADEELAQIKPLLSKINGLKILIFEKPSLPKNTDNAGQQQLMLFQNLQSDISNSLKNMKYEELITVSSKENKIKFLASDAKDGILDDVLLSINSDGNTVLMMLDGKISMDDVNTLVNEAQNQSPKSTVTMENISAGGDLQVRKVGRFSGISVATGIRVNFSQGQNQSVLVETDPGMQQYVSTEVENGILVIALKNMQGKKLNFKKLLVTIEAPRLSSVKLSSGALLTTMTLINENDFNAEISSGANFTANLKIKNKTNVGISSGSSMRMDVDTDNFEFDGSSGSMSVVNGSAKNTSIKASSAAACNAQNLVSKNGSAFASSGANIKINATENLSVTASSGATIRFRGNPKNIMKTAKNTSGGRIIADN